MAATEMAAAFYDSCRSGGSQHPRASQLANLGLDAHLCASLGIPRGTRSHDSSGFNWFKSFAQEHGLPWMRPRVVAPDKAHAESWFAAMAVYWIAPRMMPSKRTKERGIGEAKPTSALAAFYGWRRVQRDCGRHVCDPSKVASVLKGLIEQYKRQWGQNAMAVRHHTPIPLASVRRMVALCAARRVAGLSTASQAAGHVLMCFSMSRGPRLDEWAKMGPDDTLYRRGSFVWCQDKTLVGSTQAARAICGGAIPDGWFVQGDNVPSKTDRTGAKYLGKKAWYRMKRDDPLNFAAAWEAWEVAFPCPDGERDVWAAFSPDGSAAPFREGPARELLRIIATAAEGASFAARHTWHDFRATIASALIGSGYSPAFVQLVVCWASPESVALYGAASMAQFADAVDAATSTDAARHAHLDTPHVSPDTVIMELEACVAGLAVGTADDQPPSSAILREHTPAEPSVQGPKARRKPPKATRGGKETKSKRQRTAPRGRALTHDGASGAVMCDIGRAKPVSVSTDTEFSGLTLTLPESFWPGCPPTECTVVGFAATLRVGTAKGAYVLRTHDDGNMYAFKRAAVEQLLTAAQALPP